MITRERLKGAYSEGEALAIYEEVRASGDFAGFCRQYMLDDDYQVARNALWGLTKASKDELAQLQPLLAELIDLAMTSRNSSVQLSITAQDVRADFLDFCLDHMTDVQELPGIQSLCMKIAFKMCTYYPELKGEMMRTVEAMEISYYSPAVKSVRARILNGKMK